MYKEVKITIPMFIGIIILVAAVTAALVYVVNFTRDFIAKSNERMENDFQYLENALDVENRLNSINAGSSVDADESNILEENILDKIQTNEI